jgi:hypothetical protein
MGLVTSTGYWAQALFDSVAAHRFRDVSEEVRTTVIEAVGQWIVLRPATFLDDKYLKYIGWALSDKVCYLVCHSVSQAKRNQGTEIMQPSTDHANWSMQCEGRPRELGWCNVFAQVLAARMMGPATVMHLTSNPESE